MRVYCLHALLLALLASLLIGGCGGGGGRGPASIAGAGRITGSISDFAEAALTVRSIPPGTTVTVGVEGLNISTTVGPDGKFVLENVPAGLHTLVAYTDGRAIARVVKVEPGQETKVGELVLAESGQISGLVINSETRAPIVGAKVVVSEAVGELNGQMPHPVWQRRTNGNGSYTVSGLPAGEYLVTVMKEGFETISYIFYVEAGSTTPGDVNLVAMPAGAAGGLTGTVFVTHGGETVPLVGAMIRLWTDEYPPLPCAMPPGVRDSFGNPVRSAGCGEIAPAGGSRLVPPWRNYYALTGADGTYRIDGIAPGNYYVMVTRPGFSYEQKQVAVAAGKTATADFTLSLLPPVYGTIEGVVTSSATNQPVAGAEVWAISSSEPIDDDLPPIPLGSRGAVITPNPQECILTAITDSKGHYRLVVPPDVVAVGAYKDGFKPTETPARVDVGGSLTLNIPLDPVTDEQITLSGKVTVRKPDGSLVSSAGATIMAQMSLSHGGGGPDLMNQVSTTVDEQGRYRLSLKPGFYMIEASKDGCSSRWAEESLFQDTTRDFELEDYGDIMPPPVPW